MSSSMAPDAVMPELMPDEEVVRRVRAGERDLYQLLMRRHNQRVYRAVRTILRDEAEVEDVMQDAYVLAYLHLDQFAGMARFSTWLVRIAINEALGRRRVTRAVLLAREDSPEGEGSLNGAALGPSPEEEAHSRQMVSLVETALDGLPEIYRTVLVLREIEGMSTAEVAEALGTSENVVKTRMRRARARLQDRVRAGADDLAGAFSFGGPRCNSVVATVLTRLAATA